MDSVGEELDHWMSQIPGRDTPGRDTPSRETPGPDTVDTREVEAARQRIGRLARLFERVLYEVAATHDLSVGDWEALSALHRAPGPCTPTTLGRILGLTSGTVSSRLRRLTEAGLIETTAADDGRSRPIVLTDRGRTRWAQATRDRMATEREHFAALDAERLGNLNDALSGLLAEFESHYGRAPRHDRVGPDAEHGRSPRSEDPAP